MHELNKKPNVEDIFDEKVQIELSLAELAIIFSTLAISNDEKIKERLNKGSSLKYIADEMLPKKKYDDLPYNLYIQSGEILTQNKINIH